MNLVEVTNATGTYTMTYDGYGNPLRWTDPTGATATSRWNTTDTAGAYGSVLASRTDRRGRTWRYGYDARGNRVSETNPAGDTRRMTYDARGNLTAETDFAGHATRYGYDSHGFLTSVTDPTGGTTTFGYDAAGRRTSKTDPRGNTWTVAWDDADNPIETVDPLGNATRIQYDGTRATSVTDALGRTIRPSAPPSDAGTQYGFDDAGNLISVSDGNVSVSRQIDAGRVTAVTFDYGPFAKALSYGYDSAGRVATVDGPGGRTTYLYDSLDRVTRIVGPDGESAEYAYDADGRRTSATYSNGVTATYRYDAAGRTLGVRGENASGGPLFEWTYAYDPAGNVVSATDGSGAVTRYGYDALNRLVDVTYPDGGTVEYAYDAVGNRLVRADNGTRTTYTYDADGRLVGADDGTRTTYAYDANGSLVARSAGGDTTAYEYGPNGRLSAVTLPGGDRVTFGYLPTGERVRETTPNGTTYFLYGSADVVAEFDANGTLTRRFTHAPGVDEPLAVESGGALSFYHLDGLHNVRALTDANGEAVADYRYAPFGAARSTSEAVPNPYRFAGRRYDRETGLYYNRLRYYDPTVGRFTRRDPAGVAAGVNGYAYVDDNPLSGIDPYGLDTWQGGCGGGSISGPSGAFGFTKTSKCSGSLRNPESFQSCSITVTYTYYGFFAEAELAKAALSSSPIVMGGPSCGKDLKGATFYCGGFSGEVKAAGGVGVGGFVCNGDLAGALAEVEGSASEGVGGGVTVMRKGVITDAECSCVLADLNPKYENCDRCGHDDTDRPPGGDHPDDNHDLSVLSYSGRYPSYGGPPPDFAYGTGTVAVLDRGFADELTDFLVSINQSSERVALFAPQAELDGYDVLIVPSGGLIGLSSLPSFADKLDRYVSGGGTLVVLPQPRGYQLGPVPGDLGGYGWLEDQSCQFQSVGITEYCAVLSSQDDQTATISVDGYFTDYPANATVLLSRTKNGMPAMLAYDYGAGEVIATTAYTDWAYGHHASNEEGRQILRDTVKWAARTGNVTTYGPGERVALPVDVRSYVDLNADRTTVRLVSPSGTTKSIPLAESFGPLESRTLTVGTTIPRTAERGIWGLEYSLYNDSRGEVQRVRTPARFAVSNFRPSGSGWAYQGSNITLSVTSDAERYAYGSNASFAMTVRNRGDRAQNVTVWWAFPHDAGLFRNDPRYGARTTSPGHRSALNRTVLVPAGGERTINYEVPVYSFDRLWAQYYRGNASSTDYLGRTSRAFYAFRPSVDVGVRTDAKRYGWGDDATVNVSLRGDELADARVELRVIDQRNGLVYRNVTHAAAPDGTWTARRTLTLPSPAEEGFYSVVAEVFAGGEKVGYGSTQFSVPYRLRVAPSVPETLGTTSRIGFSVEHVGGVDVTNATLTASL
ncbi:MAG: RHS repeat-associated core domain-containing protein, partial [Salinigranum sp.]